MDLLQRLLEEDWDHFSNELERLHAWKHFDLFKEKLTSLKRGQLFISPIHGVGHIERVILHGAFLAMQHLESAEDIDLLLDACCYHDTGRVDDSGDSAHGARSAEKIGKLTGRSGADLILLKAVVTAHSTSDSQLEAVLRQYGLVGSERAMKLAKLLKDADGLDRVRIMDLNPRFLRLPGSKERINFAQWLYDRYADMQDAANEHGGGERIPLGLENAAEYFSAKGVIFPLHGGGEKAWCVGNAVFKHEGGGDEILWKCALLSGLETAGFRVPRYRKAKSGYWTALGWTCSTWLDGENVENGSNSDWLRVMRAGADFQNALKGEPKPEWMNERESIQALADQTAWGEQEVDWLPELRPLFEQLMQKSEGCQRQPCQLIHGDLSGDVLLHPDMDPAVIDFSPYWRPALMGLACVAADALLWHGADESLVEAAVQEFGEPMQAFTARALAFRLAIANLSLRKEKLQSSLSQEHSNFARVLSILR